MSFITGNRNQIDLIGYSIDDFVEKDSKVRFIVEIVEKLDTKEIECDYSEQGGEAYDPKIMLSTWFFSYSESETSTRKIEKNCKKNLDYIYVSANLRPDHSTLSRFRKRHIGVLGKYFVEIIKIAQKKGVSEFKQIAVDGSKIRAVSSKKKSMKGKTIQRYIQAVEKDIEKYIEEVSKEETKEEVLRLKNKAEAKKEKLQKAKQKLEERKKEISKDYRESHQVNIEEPDALMMEGGGKVSFPGYNAQIGVDTKTQIIVSAEVVQDRNDIKQFSRQHEKAESNLEKSETREYVTDGGYKSLDQLEYIAENEIKGYVGNSTQPRGKEEILRTNKKIRKSDFIYDKQNDVYICPEGRELSLKKTENNKSFKGKTYRTKQCHGCSLMSLCLSGQNKNGYREIKRDDREIYAELMNEKMQTEQGKEQLTRRRITVEPVFGNIKWNMGNSRFRLKGLENVNGEFYLVCIGHNINKLYKLLVFLFFVNLMNKKIRRRYIKIIKADDKKINEMLQVIWTR